MTELESLPVKDRKGQPKSTSRKRAFVKAVGVGAASLVAVGVVRRVLQKPAKSQIVIPEDHPVTSGSKFLKSGRHKLATVMADSLSPRQVAEMLATSAPSVVRRIRARSLYGIPFAGTWLVPTFQFRDGALLRGMEEVLPRLDSGLHPLEVINWFSIRNSDLVMGGNPVSPAVWLERGGDVDSVATLAAEVGSGL
jgi:hypothetical protein